MKGSRIGSVTVNVKDVERKVTADFYVSAIPVEKMVELLNPEMVSAAPDFENIKQLKTDWMNGIQFYLSTDVPVIHGHVIYLDSKWAITSISQHQFWDSVDLSKHGNGKVEGILSVDVSDWHTKGDQVVLKAAKDCSAEEIKAESWAQIKSSPSRVDSGFPSSSTRISRFRYRSGQPREDARNQPGASPH